MALREDPPDVAHGDAVLRKIQEGIDRFGRKSKKAKSITYTLQITVMVLAAASTVLLGLQIEGETYNRVSRNVALVIGALITFLSALASFWNIESYWLRHELKQSQLETLKERYLLLEVKNGAENEEVRDLLEEYLRIVDRSSIWAEAEGRSARRNGEGGERSLAPASERRPYTDG